MRTSRTLAYTLLAFLFTGSMAIAQITGDYDKSVDFSSYKTYTFEGWEKNSDQILTDFDKKRILDALRNELSSRGLNLVNSGGDAAITLFIVVNNKTSKTAYTDFNSNMGYMGGWGYGYRWGGMPMNATATTTVSENDYKEGTFVVDMYDAGTKKLVWQGVITSVVQEKPQKRDKSIPKKVKKLMKQYPVKPMK